jgi:hypothetical protein
MRSISDRFPVAEANSKSPSSGKVGRVGATRDEELRNRERDYALQKECLTRYSRKPVVISLHPASPLQAISTLDRVCAPSAVSGGEKIGHKAAVFSRVVAEQN